MTYFRESDGVYRECEMLEKQENMLLPFNDLCLDWDFVEDNPDIKAAGRSIIICGEDAIASWKDRIDCFKERFAFLKSMVLSSIDEPKFRKKLLMVDVGAGGEGFMDTLDVELGFWRKIQHLVDWCNNIDDGYTFLFIGGSYGGLPEGSFNFQLVQNTHLYRDDNLDFFGTLDHHGGLKAHKMKIVGGLTKDRTGSWHSST